MDIGCAGEPLSNPFPARRDHQRFALWLHGWIIRACSIWCRGDAEQRWLHRARRNFEWLQEEGADRHGHGEGNEENLNVFTPCSIWIRLQPLGGYFLQFSHLLFQSRPIRFASDGGVEFEHPLLHRCDCLWRKNVALMV